MARRYSWRARNKNQIYAITAIIIIVVLYIIYRGAHRKPSPGTEAPAATTLDTELTTEVHTDVGIEERVEEYRLATVPGELTAEPNSRAAELITEAVQCINAKPARLIEARDILNEALPMPMNSQQRAFVKEQLSKLADKWLFSRTIYPQDGLCETYKVQQGDQLSAISNKYKVPYEILMEINNIPRPESLKAGETIKVINGPFHARVYRSAFTMDLYLQNTFVRSFPVGLGQPGLETPTGLWVVKPKGKMISPTWTDPSTGKTYKAADPDYPLGSRWIGLEGIEGAAKDRTGFAIHGTKDPVQIGTAESRGCIRLHNGDVILVYNLMMPGYSQVHVVE